MSATRPRRHFASPFVVTVVAACGGKAPPPPVVTAVPAAPIETAAAPADAAPVTSTEEPVLGTAPVHWNPPAPQPVATRDLKWRVTRTGTGDDAKCQAQQVEACQQAKKPCAPPTESHLCVLEDSSLPPEKHHRYPLFVEQKKDATECYIVGSNPPERTYCPDEWTPPTK